MLKLITLPAATVAPMIATLRAAPYSELGR